MPQRWFKQEDETVVIKVTLVKSLYEAKKKILFNVPHYLMCQSK